MFISTLPSRTMHRLAHPPDIFGRLATRHPEPAHQGVGHFGGKAIANRGGATDMSIEDRIHLWLGKTLRLKDIDKGQESDLTRRLIDDLDNLGAGWTRSAH
jgi:hypothetical protein